MSREQAVPANSAVWLGIANHIVLAVFKGTVGLLFDSKALLAGALHSATDGAALVCGKLKLPRQTPKNGEFRRTGAGKAGEPLLAIFLSVFLLMGSLQMGISSIGEISQGEIAPPGALAGVAIVISIALQEALFQYQYRQLRRSKSEQLQTLVESHRHSLYASVAVLIGVFGAMTGQEMEVPLLLYLDPVASLLVSVMVLWRVYRMILGTVYGSLISDTQEEDASLFIETVQRVHGVITVDELKAKENGHYVTVTARISVNPRITVLEANEIATRAKVLLMTRFSHISEVSIQVLPYDPGYPYKSNFEGPSDDLPTLLQ